MSRKQNNRLMIFSSIASLATVCILLVLKTIAFFTTNSVAILSSLFDSIQDLVTSGVNLVAIKQAVQPPDTDHRFGHGKAQGIGALIQAVIITVSALFLAAESIKHLIQHQKAHDIGFGVEVILISLILTMGLILFQNYVIKKTSSLSIKADYAHYAGDILMNIGVLLALFGNTYLNCWWMDGLFGILVSIYLLRTVWHIASESISLLMDKELDTSTRHTIHDIAMQVKGVRKISSLKTRAGGDCMFIQFNIHLDGKLSLHKAHQITDEVESKLREKYPQAEIIIHAEPFQNSKGKDKNAI